MEDSNRFDLRIPLRYGLIAGIVALSLSVIGIVALFAERFLVAGYITLGEVILFLAPAAMSYMAAGKAPQDKKWAALIYGLLTGLIAAIPLIILVLLAGVIDIRQFLPNVSPALIELLTFGRGINAGGLVLLVVSGLIGLLSAALSLLPERIRKPTMYGLLGVFLVGMFSEILSERLRAFFGLDAVKIIFEADALKPIAAVIIFIITALLTALWMERGDKVKSRFESLQPKQKTQVRSGSLVLGIALMVILPLLLGTYLSEVVNNVLIFALMGFGLNIVVGFAGLLDLGYVAFFAIGAYTMGILTSSGDLGVAGMSFWVAVPICVAIATFGGILLGMPVLRMRGDYLAIVTLGFGEIIRILALSDLLKPYIGGAQGLLQIDKPVIFGTALIKPDNFYYVVLGGVIIAAFISYRLSQARLGRQWMAMREDEDVAEAMGIKLVNTKLLAFAIGAAFAGLSGAIFASKLTSIFPHSFNILISINVLCMIIVGGMGSLPGVILGALALVGLPEILREFAEFRLLMYGVILIVMMLAKPEGFWPSAVRKRELHVYDDSDYEEFPEANAPRAETRDPGMHTPPHL